MSGQHNSPNTLENIAAELTVLAGDLARGKLRVGNRLFDIGNPLSVKTKQKITGDSAHFTLSFQAPLLDSDREAIAAAGLKQTPAEGPEEKHDKKFRLQGLPPEGKKIKKNISSLWRAVSRKLEQGQAPTPAEEKSLISAFESYTVFSEPAWQEEWLACFATLQQALTCARGGDMPGALEYAAKVNALTKTCHKKHK
jgi:hypothetical protein